MLELDKHTGHRGHFRPKEIEQLISEAVHFGVRWEPDFRFSIFCRYVVILRGKQPT